MELLNKKGGLLPERHARKIVKQIATAFDYLYSEEVIHRDMKMENIMLHFPNRPV
jgi:serine/threonine protein kinase